MTDCIKLITSQLPSPELQYSICAYLHSDDYNKFKLTEPKVICNSKGKFINIEKNDLIDKGNIAMNMFLRLFHQLPNNSIDDYSVAKMSNIKLINKIYLTLELNNSSDNIYNLDYEILKNYVILKFKNLVVNTGDKLPMHINGATFKFIVNNIDLFNKGDDNMYGIFNELTIIDIKTNNTNIKIKNNTTTNQLFNENTFDFKNLDIGGLNSELSTIFRRVFASRVLPSSLIEKLDIKHPKGVIFYGPPGTGKTLTARNLSKSLKAKSIQIVNGPELINSYVGKSEENVRNLFKQAEAEKDQEGLHVIIFDEFDSLCKKRGETSGVSGDVNDKIVTQLLSKIDGYEALNNILLIGMTNRIDLLDPAILRPGRFEVHIEITLPNEEGRIEILNIHTKKLRENKCLDESVDIDEIAKNTKNYTGAELEGLVRDARSYAINKLINIDKLDKVIKMEDILITQAHFMKAIEAYIPKFGTSEIDISYYMPKGIICQKVLLIITMNL